MKAMWLKLFAGVLLLLTGVLVLLVLIVHYVGHTAAGFSKSEYIIGGVLSVLLIFSAIAVFAAGLYSGQRNVRKK
jgi:Kef-type K+ transport system membrane component KefB